MAITVKSVSKYYGPVRAVDNLSFRVQPGEVVGLLGPNGAGKTTVVRMITGFLSPSGGTVEVNGKDVRENPLEVRRLIGYLPEDNPLYPDMDVIEYLEYVARLHEVPRSMIARRVKGVLETFDLQEVRDREIRQLSKGYRQRVGIAQAMVHHPPILLLDEPTNALDPNQILEFRHYIRQLGKEKTIIISTHTLSEVQAVCDKVIIIDRGKKLADATIPELAMQFEGTFRYFFGVELPPGYEVARAEQYLREVEGVVLVTPLSHGDEGANTTGFYLETKRDASVRGRLFALCVQQGWPLIHLHRNRVQIDDIFHRITTGHDAQ
ncbi:MAG: ATP-binding cassette domain-containing protein [Bacteroidota bacterium]